MQKLNLPSFEYKLRETGGKREIFDVVRKKYLRLTPEEWVRQHIVHLLIGHLDFPAGLIKMEGGLVYEKLEKRSDILVFDLSAKPYLLIECKAPEVQVSNKTLDQVSRYNKVVKAPFLAMTNGIKTYCFAIDHEKGSSFQMDNFPPSPNLKAIQPEQNR
jgi:hypothetical protein